MAKGSSKKPGEPKCRGCGGLLEGKRVARIGGNMWHRECAEKAGKFIPVEYREDAVAARRAAQEAAAAEAHSEPEEATTEAEAADEEVEETEEAEDTETAEQPA